jgi:hypothetical protein
MNGNTLDSAGDERRGENLFADAQPICPACGACARRAQARFCATCGHSLEEDYFPTDSLRASYRFERRPKAYAPKRPVLPPRERALMLSARARVRREAMPKRASSYNAVTATARAFIAYALVPYLGILFCPGALLLGGVGLFHAGRAPHAGARREAIVSIALGLLILCAQLALWWVLYKVPEWSRRAPF